MRKINGREYMVVDAHLHIGEFSLGFWRTFAEYRFGKRETTPSRIARAAGVHGPYEQCISFLGADAISYMDKVGVDKGVAFPPTLMPGSDYSVESKIIAEEMRKYPDRIVGVGRINPHRPIDVDEIKKLGLRGVKLHPKMEYFTVNNKTLVYPIVEQMEKLGLALLVHTGDHLFQCAPGFLFDLAMDFPKLPILACHMGEYPDVYEAFALFKRTDNVYLGTSDIPFPGIIRQAVNTVGAERVVLECNFPYTPHEFEIDKVAKYAGLTDDELKLVLGENICRMLKIKIG